jgi:hypothetical protein
MSVPGYEPLNRPPQVGDPVKVVVEGTIDAITDEGDAIVVLHGDRLVTESAVVVMPVEQVWNQARPDNPITTT